MNSRNHILIVTQKVDLSDPVLGFFHQWLFQFSKEFEQVYVICLEKGVFSLPSNVTILSLGKEIYRSQIRYIYRLFLYIWRYRDKYDFVFVHMNKEYIVLAGWLFVLLQKKILFWYNHIIGDWKVVIASHISNIVLYTSTFAFSARFKNATQCPVGIDTSIFYPEENRFFTPKKNRLMVIGRLSPVKNLEMIIDALQKLKSEGYQYECTIVGDPVEGSEVYSIKLKKQANELVEKGCIVFEPAIPFNKLRAKYNQCDIVLNATNNGSFDKTILEAVACGCVVITSNQALGAILPSDWITSDATSVSIKDSLVDIFSHEIPSLQQLSNGMVERVREEHDIKVLVKKIHQLITGV